MSDRLSKQKKLVPISETAKILDVSIDTVRRWDKSGVLHSERPDGKNRYFSLDELEHLKSSLPLSISEAARELGISPVTLRRLESRGSLIPIRNRAGERIYDKNSIKKFQNSDYILRKKQIKEKVIDPVQTKNEPTENVSEDFKNINLDSKPYSNIFNYIAMSTAIFLLLFTLGVGNIKLTEAKSYQLSSRPTAEVLGKTVAIAIKPAETKEATAETKPTVATPAAIIKATLTIKTDDASSIVNIRQKPTTNSPKVAEAKNGDSFEFVSINSGWYEIKLTDGSNGFVSAKYVVKGANN